MGTQKAIAGNDNKRHNNTMTPTEQVHAQIDTIYRTESRRVFATLVRLLGDFDLAEDALHDAFKVAMEQWPRDGIPVKPRPWLISTGRFKGALQVIHLVFNEGYNVS